MTADGLTEARLAVTAAAIAGDSGSLYHLVAGLLDDGVPFESILFDLLMPAEADIGHRWQEGDYLVAEEHAATAAIETVVSLLAGSFETDPDGRHVVVAAAQGDTHSLPGRVIAAHLLYLGYRTTFLGANALASDLGEYLEVETPEALVLSCAMSTHLPGARAAIRASHAAGVPVLVGGRAFGESGVWAAAVGADSWVPSAREVPEMLESWTPEPSAAEARAVIPPAGLPTMAAHRMALLADAQSWLAASMSTVEVDHRLRDELGLLTDALEASLLVDDPALITEVLEWQRHLLATDGLVEADTLARALHWALSERASDIADHLESGAWPDPS